jgi:hypothetical protein
MTLIITLVSPSWIHQSADFQLSELAKSADGDWIVSQPNSSKIVSLRYQKWSGLLTYCGMGMWNGRRTDEYAAEWLTGLSSSEATFDDAVEKIREEGTAWLARISQATGKEQHHTFVLGGYEGGGRIITIISNYETLRGRIAPISDQLKVDTRRSASGTHVFINGIRDAVPNASRRRLKHLAEIGTDPNVIRYELGKVNLQAAKSPAAHNGISSACLAV